MVINSNLELSGEDLDKLCKAHGTSLSEIEESLTLPNPEYSRVMRFGHQKRFYTKIPPKFCYLKKNGDTYILPRYYFGGTYKMTPHVMISDKCNNGVELSSEIKLHLRDYQKTFLSDNEEILRSNTGVLLEAPCGHGKTLLGLWISYFWNRRTLIVVPTYYLAKQWKARIDEFTTAKSIIIKSTDSKIPTDADFTIVVMDLFVVRTLPETLVKNIGIVILDEAHRVGAESYMPILNEIPAEYRLALTATFRRNDGMHKILKYHFGTHIKMTNRFPKPAIYALTTKVKIRGLISKSKPHQRFMEWLEGKRVPFVETKGSVEFAEVDFLKEELERDLKKGLIQKNTYLEARLCLKRASDIPYVCLDTFLNEHSRRRKLVISLIKKCLDSGRTILFLSKRKDILKSLYKYFGDYKPMLIVSETTERSEEDEHYLQTSCRLILGVTQLAKEGLDIDRLDTLIIHLPMKDIEQAVGRISRIYPDKRNALAFYLLDDHPIIYSVWKGAQKSCDSNGEIKGEVSFDKIDEILNWSL